tara:strand:+ start:1797 stop:1973 length:177 start_codon:yes stop_codon:yes gene_type:complete
MSDPIGRTSEQYKTQEQYSDLILDLHRLKETTWFLIGSIDSAIDKVEEMKKDNFDDAN